MCLNGYCLPKGYKQDDLPTKSTGKKAMEVKIGFTYLEVLEINENDFSVTFRAIVIGRWEEPRLIPPKDASKPTNANDTDNDLDTANDNEIYRVLDTSILDHLWIMNLLIYNLKKVQKFKTLTMGDNSLGTH